MRQVWQALSDIAGESEAWTAKADERDLRPGSTVGTDDLDRFERIGTFV
jgi:hypothetical protein